MELSKLGILRTVAENLLIESSAPEKSIAEIIDLDGNPPPLRRDMERLLDCTDSDRNMTFLFMPTALFAERDSVFSGQLSPLRDPVFWFLGDEFSAVAISLHWDKNFFVELVAIPTLDTSPEQASRILAERLAELPDRIEKYLATLEPQPYSQNVLARFPLMLRTMVNFTRSGVEGDHVVLRCYLPADAGRKLLMGAELTLAESLGVAGSTKELNRRFRHIDRANTRLLKSAAKSHLAAFWARYLGVGPCPALKGHRRGDCHTRS